MMVTDKLVLLLLWTSASCKAFMETNYAQVLKMKTKIPILQIKDLNFSVLTVNVSLLALRMVDINSMIPIGAINLSVPMIGALLVFLFLKTKTEKQYVDVKVQKYLLTLAIKIKEKSNVLLTFNNSAITFLYVPIIVEQTVYVYVVHVYVFKVSEVQIVL